MFSCLVSRENEATVLWVPAHSGIVGNETADQFAKEAVGGRQHGVSDELRWEASFSHLTRAVTETRSRATAQWISAHAKPERRHRPPTGSGLRRKALRRVRKSLASRCCQLLSGHAATGSFLHERMTGPLSKESSECQWCCCGKWELRYHLFVECKA